MTAPRANRKALRARAKKEQLLTTPEAAQITGYATDHIALMLRKGLLGGAKRGRDWLVSASSLLEYIEKNPKPGRKIDG